MKTKLSYVMLSIQALAALCSVGAVKIWAPVCGKLLTLTTGKEVPMRCYYTGQAAIAVAGIMLAAAVVALLCKKGHRKLMIISIVAAVMLFLLFSSLIGVCASPEMRCHATDYWCRGAAVVSIAAAVIELLSGKEGQIPG